MSPAVKHRGPRSGHSSAGGCSSHGVCARPSLAADAPRGSIRAEGVVSGTKGRRIDATDAIAPAGTVADEPDVDRAPRRPLMTWAMSSRPLTLLGCAARAEMEPDQQRE